jgi:hypothetical protein
MIWSKPIIGYRNKIAEMMMDVDRCDLIGTSKLTFEEREWLKSHFQTILNYIGKKLKPTRPK